MSEVQTFRCDICGVQKQSVNHWWRAYILDRNVNGKSAGMVILEHDVQSLTQALSRQPINFPKKADADLCGFDCVTKFVGQQMQEIVNA